MTLKRALTLITQWLADQGDLTGFSVEYADARVRVVMRRGARAVEWSASDLELSRLRCDASIVVALDVTKPGLPSSRSYWNSNI